MIEPHQADRGSSVRIAYLAGEEARRLHWAGEFCEHSAVSVIDE
ncbi:MAG TPA: hypothetical protein VE662_03755 [Solirubrobacterales bacterium]|nr:hypothetical protein [Solirubrobacterales bacterium]